MVIEAQWSEISDGKGHIYDPLVCVNSYNLQFRSLRVYGMIELCFPKKTRDPAPIVSQETTRW